MKLYQVRMQIEEGFRDSKNYRYGLGMPAPIALDNSVEQTCCQSLRWLPSSFGVSVLPGRISRSLNRYA
jgi:hypothetical protein